MIRNWTLMRTEPLPQAASLERWLALGGVAGPVLFVLAFTVAGMLGIIPETNPLHWQLGAPLVYGGATLGFLPAGLLLRRSPAWRGWPRSHGGPGMQDGTELARHRPVVCSPAAHTSPSGKEQE